jgi:hypothetical protein
LKQNFEKGSKNFQNVFSEKKLRKCSNIVQKYYSKKFQKYQIFFFQKVFSNEISKKFKFCFKKNFKKGSEIIQKEISLKKIKKVYTMFFQK